MNAAANRLTAWSIDAHAFAALSGIEDQLRFCLRYAILAPSTHNTQPWRFQLENDTVLLCADRTRALPVSDTYDRELVISCGAALFNLRVALSHFGCPYEIRLMPSTAEPDVLASVRISPDGFLDKRIAPLLPSITARVTNRQGFDPAPVTEAVVGMLHDAARAEGVGLVHVSAEADRMRFAGLIDEADRAQLADPRFRRELALWLNARRRDDGMSTYSATAGGLLDFATPLTASVVRTFDRGNGIAASHRHLVYGSPLLICLASAADNSEAWLVTGQAMQRVLLTLTAQGLFASFLNQPIEVAELRTEVHALAQGDTYPQILLRVGRGVPQDHSPRRSLESVLS